FVERVIAAALDIQQHGFVDTRGCSHVRRARESPRVNRCGAISFPVTLQHLGLPGWRVSKLRSTLYRRQPASARTFHSARENVTWRANVVGQAPRTAPAAPEIHRERAATSANIRSSAQADSRPPRSTKTRDPPRRAWADARAHRGATPRATPHTTPQCDAQAAFPPLRGDSRACDAPRRAAP